MEYKRPYVKESTMAAYTLAIKNSILPAFGECDDMRKLSEKLGKIADMLGNLPPDSDTLKMIDEARSAYSRLLKIQ